MSILIKMEMPKECKDCPIYNGEYLHCNITKTEPWQGHEDDDVVPIPSDCPLVPIPPHGRLIDASVLDKMTMWDTNREYDKGWNSAVRMAQERVADAPTIIEAEGEDE